jgi:hypothetical protein
MPKGSSLKKRYRALLEASRCNEKGAVRPKRSLLKYLPYRPQVEKAIYIIDIGHNSDVPSEPR